MEKGCAHLDVQIFEVTNESQKQQALQIRKIVFVEEQHVPESLELDEYDTHSETSHWLLTVNKQPIGTARFRPYQLQTIKIERVAILQEARGQGYGEALMRAMEAQARVRGFIKARLNAQIQALAFYEKLNYLPIGERFEEAGILHQTMEKDISHFVL